MIVGRIANRGIVSSQEIKEAYKKAFNIPKFSPCWNNKPCFHFADETYEETDLDLIKQVIEENQADKAQYITEKRDCDNFSFDLMGALRGVDDRTCGMPIFIVWVLTPHGGHALLSFYHQSKVYLIEPQTDEITDSISPEYKLILIIG